MPASMPNDTARALGENAKLCDSRSLFFDKFADPSAKDSGNATPRKNWFRDVIKRKPFPSKLSAWAYWLNGLGLSQANILRVKLQSRLMVNMAGGVMENAGLCFDRFGIPYIPGSTVKGCARRMAIQLVKEARETNRPDAELAALLADIALVLGWGQDDWNKLDKDKHGQLKSDFVYSIGLDRWDEVFRQTGTLLLRSKPEQPEDFGHFAGTVSFLPAYPHQLPANDLELDVVTCHHPKYYQNRDPSAIAIDDEEPVPVTFITVAAGIIFAFVTVPLRGERDSLSQPGMKVHTLASDWLRQGLDIFGIGAKTAAGYGWFRDAHATKTMSGSSPGEEQRTATAAEHPLIAEWRGKTQPPNFRGFRPLLVALNDDDLKTVFHAIIPANELARLKRSNPYWQSFASHPDGITILRRLKIELL